MEIIVNCKTFREIIKRANDAECHTIQYSVSLKSLIFCTAIREDQITFPVEKRNPGVSELVKFNGFKMGRLYNFLGLLREQPVRIELDDEDVTITNCVVYL